MLFRSGVAGRSSVPEGGVAGRSSVPEGGVAGRISVSEGGVAGRISVPGGSVVAAEISSMINFFVLLRSKKSSFDPRSILN